jgi:hypothetical protein
MSDPLLSVRLNKPFAPKQANLADQLRARIKAVKIAMKDLSNDFGFGTGESRSQYEKRIENTPEAWDDCGRNDQNILPR